MSFSFFTIGHSTHTIKKFVDILAAANVTMVVDVRTIPKSRTNPQYNYDVLPLSLAQFQIEYAYIPELGGLREKSKIIDQDLNGFWKNQSFHNYADYALTDAFQLGLERLMAMGRQQRCAIMCAESVWWRCHRRIIADYLLVRGETVFHLMGQHSIKVAELTNGAIIKPPFKIFYPPQ